MSSPRVPIFETISTAWSEGLRAVAAMPLVAGIALVLMLAIGSAGYFGSYALLMSPGRSVQEWVRSPAWFVFGLLYASVQIILLSPLLIAVHRYVIRGDAARGYPLHPLRPSYLGYVGTLLAGNFAYRAPELITILLPNSPDLPWIVNFALWLLMILLMLAMLITFIRRTALFPAIAIGAPNANWREATPADAGNVLRILIVLAGVLLPGVIAMLLLNWYVITPIWPVHWPIWTGGLALSNTMSLLQLPTLCVLAAAASRIYLAGGATLSPGLAGSEARPAIA